MIDSDLILILAVLLLLLD